MQLAIRVTGEPDFLPEQLDDLDAPPPHGTLVDIDDREFVVVRVWLHSRRRMDGSSKRRNYYIAELAPLVPAADGA